MSEQNIEAQKREYLLKSYAELGLTEETATRLKTLLEANGYSVDFGYSISVHSSTSERYASLTDSRGVITVSTTSSWWTFQQAKIFQTQLNKCVELMAEISSFAPTVIDPTFQEQREKERREVEKKNTLARIDKWNALPKEETVLELPSGCKVQLIRQEVEYKVGYSTKFYARIGIVNPSGVSYTIMVDRYITNDGKVQRKKFTDDYSNMTVADAGVVIANLTKLNEMVRLAQRGSS